jgi:hypothetical protein
MRTQFAPLVLAVLCLAGCGDSDDSLPNLRIAVATTGLDEDPNGYVANAGSRFTTSLPVNGIREFILDPGTYEFRIEGLAPNCALQGPASTSVTISSGVPAELVLSVQCRAVTGVIEVRAPTSGRDFPLVGYSLYVTSPAGDSWLSAVPVTYPAIMPSLSPGLYELRFEPAANCTLNGEDIRIVTVTAGGLTRDTAKVAFEVTCRSTTGDVRLSITTTGTAPDPNGYTVAVDGVLVEDYYDYYGNDPVPLRLSSNGSHTFERLVPGDHVIELREVAANCAVQGQHPRTVSVSLGAVAELAIDVVCGAS